MSEWVVEAALQFVRQPLWTTPVQNFIDINCACFDTEDELKLEYTAIHKKFQDLVEGILETMLEELGAGPEVLVEACETQKDTDPNIKRFLQYLYSLDDFRSFRAIMMKRNVELEQEAMAAWGKMQEYHARQQAGAADVDEVDEKPEPTDDDDDAKQLELALQASLQDDEKIMKAAELEDADLQAALALSAAEETERIRREEQTDRAKADQDKKDADEKAATAASAASAKDASDAAVTAAAETIKKQAEAEAAIEHKKAEEAIAKKKADAQAALQAKEEQVLHERKEKLAAAVAAAEKARDEEKVRNPDAPAVLRTSLTEVSDKKLPGLGEVQNHRGGGGFGKYGALPTLQPSFATLAREVSPAIVKKEETAPSKPGQSAADKAALEAQQKAEMEARAKYMAEQRRKLIDAKREKREGDLSAFCQANQLANTPEVHAQTGSTAAVSKEEKEHRDMSRALMRRFKDDLIQESTKPVN